MEIESIRNNLYDNRGGFNNSNAKGRNTKKQEPVSQPVAAPLDAFMFQSISAKDKLTQELQDRINLAEFINAIPDEEVSRRMKQFKRSYKDIESALVDKLIMEEL
jgi:hypothetical protein